MSLVQKLDLSGKKIIVAGASSGIGRQAAITLSENGARIIAIARRENMLMETTNQLKGEGHCHYSFDLTNIEGIPELIKRIVSENGKLDGLAYCAGIGRTLPLKSFSPKMVDEVMRINFYAFYEIVRQFCKKNCYNPSAKIVGISSIASIAGSKGQSIYGASKGAMDSAVKVISQELIEKGININTIRPTFVKTELYDKFISNSDDGEGRLKTYQPLGPIETEDVAYLITYLMSPAGKYITGQQIDIWGGHADA